MESGYSIFLRLLGHKMHENFFHFLIGLLLLIFTRGSFEF